MKVWVLTRAINEYDQDGEYFEAVFEKKPSVEQLAQLFSDNDSFPTSDFLATVEHIHAGGGRQNIENVWYYLREVETVTVEGVTHKEKNNEA